MARGGFQESSNDQYGGALPTVGFGSEKQLDRIRAALRAYSMFTPAE